MNYKLKLKLLDLYSRFETAFPFTSKMRIGWYKLTHKKPKRYDALTKIIRETKTASILEVGVWNGNHAVEMITAAQENNEIVTYYGFDVFENINASLAKESSTKIPPSEEAVLNKLKKTGANIQLFKGYTQDTLYNFCMFFQIVSPDFVFIDGGHSLEVVQSDWDNIKTIIDHYSVVVFDDYWNITSAGCKQLIDGLDRDKYEVEILPAVDKFKKDWGTLKIQFATVKLRR